MNRVGDAGVVVVERQHGRDPRDRLEEGVLGYPVREDQDRPQLDIDWGSIAAVGGSG
jgi:hypothetical protein